MARANTAKKDVRERMQELYVYDLYGFRPEIKSLSALLYPYETINCFATGVHQGLRRMVVVTVYRVLVIGNRLASGADVIAIPRKDVLSHTHNKRFFTSSIEFDTAKNHYEFTNVSRRVLELFDWALDQPLPDTK